MTEQKGNIRKSDQMEELIKFVTETPQTANSIHSKVELNTNIKRYETTRKYLNILVAQGQIVKEEYGTFTFYKSKPRGVENGH